MNLIVCIVIAYALGSINSAILVCQLLKLEDPRNQGSGNPGATNAYRIGGKKVAALVFLGDALKGYIPLFIALNVFGLHGESLGVLAVAACLGHIFPMFFGFKGGKGIATMFGTLLAVNYFIGIICALVWVGIVLLTRYVSLASLIATATAPVLFLVLSPDNFIPFLIIAAIVTWTHRANIDRLRKGEEKKV